MLIEVADRLRSALRAEDLAVRLGGDEFVILLDSTVTVAEATLVAQRLVTSIGHDFVVNGERISIGASVGLSISRAKDTPDQLLRAADSAAYHAKRSGPRASRHRRNWIPEPTDSGRFRYPVRPVGGRLSSMPSRRRPKTPPRRDRRSGEALRRGGAPVGGRATGRRPSASSASALEAERDAELAAARAAALEDARRELDVAIEASREARRTGRGTADADAAWKLAKARVIELETGAPPDLGPCPADRATRSADGAIHSADEPSRHVGSTRGRSPWRSTTPSPACSRCRWPKVFRRRYLVLPPIKEVRDQSGDWARAGETRRLHTSDGGTMLETLTAVEPPTRFAYRSPTITGPLKPLTQKIEGEFAFAPAGTGTMVTWRWRVHATFRVPRCWRCAALGRMWSGYARQALEELETELLRLA